MYITLLTCLSLYWSFTWRASHRGASGQLHTQKKADCCGDRHSVSLIALINKRQSLRGLSTNDREKAKEGEKARNKQRKIYTYICIKRNITCAKG